MTIYLYIKTHNKTGLKYFGKTTKKDPHKYTGSGTYWKRHLHKHGADYTTQIVAEFEDVIACQEFALKFSIEHDIVKSTDWANLQEENGLDGAPKGHPGHKFTADQLERISTSSKLRWDNPEQRKILLESQVNSWTKERKQKQSQRLSGIKRPDHSEKMKGRELPENHPFFNKTKTDEHKQNISKALLNKQKSEEHKQNLKQSIQSRPQEDWEKILETRRNKSKPKFEIDGVSYVSLNQASGELGVTPFFVKKLITRHL